MAKNPQVKAYGDWLLVLRRERERPVRSIYGPGFRSLDESKGVTSTVKEADIPWPVGGIRLARIERTVAL